MGTLAQTMIENGERTAPVSYMYISMLQGMLEETFRMQEPRFFELQIIFFKHMVKKDELFQKTSKKFQKEFSEVLEYPIDELYYWIFKEPYVPYKDSLAVNVEVNIEPEKNIGLSLVK